MEIYIVCVFVCVDECCTYMHICVVCACICVNVFSVPWETRVLCTCYMAMNVTRSVAFGCNKLIKKIYITLYIYFVYIVNI